MSINVTVTGNPVSVRRGKMVTTGASGEFDRRRLVRLEQVRQQSRDIAEGVREKVRKEKRKQLGELEEEGREKLRRSQNRRLLELQTQYRDGLRELGVGHREAEKENDRERQLSRKREAEHRDAVRRGNEAAAALLQPEKHLPERPKETTVKQKATRSVVKPTTTKNRTKTKKKVASQTTRHVSKKRRSATADININIPGTDTDEGSDKSSAIEDTSSSDKTEASNDVESSDASPRRPPEATPVEQRSGPCLTPVEESPSNTSRESNREPTSPVKSTGLGKFLRDLAGPPDVPHLDTRISERIRQRVLVPAESERVPDKRHCSCGKFLQEFSQGASNLFEEPSRDIQKPIDYTRGRCRCDNELRNKFVQVQEEKVPGPIPEGSSKNITRPVDEYKVRCPCDKSVQVQEEKLSAPEGSSKGLPGSETNRRRCPCDKTGVEVRSKSVQVQVEEERGDLPDLPEVNLRTSSETFKSGSGTSKVQFYDHASRTCAERRVPIDSYLERNVPGPREALPREPSVCCDEAKRQRDAQARFRRALERDRISKDYEEMLRRLPLLEKRERVAGIARDRPEHHMAEGRAREEERRRQNAMENEFAHVFQRREAIVTIPKRGPGAAGGPGTWDEERPPTEVLNVHRTSAEREEPLDEPKIFTAHEVQDIVKAFTGRNVDERRRKLQELLESLKLQKEELIREIRKIPADESVNELIRDLDSVVQDDKDVKKKRRRRRKEAEDSSSSSSEVRVKGKKERRRDSTKVRVRQAGFEG